MSFQINRVNTLKVEFFFLNTDAYNTSPTIQYTINTQTFYVYVNLKRVITTYIYRNGVNMNYINIIIICSYLLSFFLINSIICVKCKTHSLRIRNKRTYMILRTQ